MAFVSNSFTRIANLMGLASPSDITPGFCVYQAGADTIATLLGAGYFNGRAGSLSVGSIIQCLCADGLHTVKVTANAAGVVTVADASQVDKIASGQAVTVTANDVVVSGLGALKAVLVSFNDDIGLTEAWVTGNIGNQAGAPAAGSFNLKTWEPTSNANPTPIAATTFGKAVNWIAIAA